MTDSVTIGQAIDSLLHDGSPVRFSAYDGSVAGPPDAKIELHLKNERGLSYIMTAPGDLGMARAYVMGDLELRGVHPGDPYEAMALLVNHLKFRRPSVSEALRLVRGLGIDKLRPPPVPPQEHLPRWRRAFEGLRHSMNRDAEVIKHHYDVSNRFYEMVLGPSMTYTCALFETPEATLEEAQAAKYDLICRKLNLQPGQRLLDVGCGWGGMVRHAAREYGVKALGVTLSLEQAQWAKEAIDREGLGDLAEVRHLDYREVMETGFDAVSSIGLTEHIGVRNYPSYFTFLREKLRPGGRLLNHSITRPHNRPTETGAFIDRYVFPDGELIGSGTIVAAAQDAGLEVQHTENIREHYAMTLAGWCRNLEANWDECVAEVGEGTARVWGIYMAGSRIGFERDEIELHHVLATRNDERGASGFPLRPDWIA
ncbi:SAM-dependent methyltransferase [Nocardioides sp. Root151]|uniref:SAM-dependent methyltransferase n=1 Tax=Nocardioides sp. Root151 TaxID=1736475 RepID=UPI0007025F02|nr:cyclopropane-fatty-acyl-phospholipid synthase family protein [Nocardioides sp. Root151]KQZ66473.1 cyclopropane-fatty-acyl-phospholipid synthase [Nocardioides sp. Root151]